jgi:WD40 repeat protein
MATFGSPSGGRASTTPSCAPICVLRGHIDTVTSVSLLGGNLLASGDVSGKLYVWSLDRKRPVYSNRTCHEAGTSVYSIAKSVAQSQLYTYVVVLDCVYMCVCLM